MDAGAPVVQGEIRPFPPARNLPTFINHETSLGAGEALVVGPGAYIRASHRSKGVVCYLFFIDCFPRGAAVGKVIEARRVMARAHPVQSGLVMKRSSTKKTGT